MRAWDRAGVLDERLLAQIEGLSTPQRARLADRALHTALVDFFTVQSQAVLFTLADTIRNGLRALRQHLSSAEYAEVTWASPFIEMQYDVFFRANNLATSVPRLRLKSDWTDAELADSKAMARALTTSYLTLRNRLVLSDLTHEVALVHAKEQPLVLLPAAARAVWAELPSDEQTTYLGELLQPVTVGQFPLVNLASSWDPTTYLVADSNDALEHEAQSTSDQLNLELDIWPGRIPVVVADDLLATLAELLTVGWTRRGEPVTVSAVAAVHPLQIIEAESRAYFPVGIGLLFNSPTTPPNWSAEEQNEFWDFLNATLVERSQALQRPDPLGSTTGFSEQGAAVAPPPERKPFPISFGPSRADHRALEFVSQLHQLRLPKRWSTIPRWEQLAEQEVSRLIDEYGEEAFERTGEHNAQLIRRTNRDGTETIRLSTEAERTLKISTGLRTGYLQVDERDRTEYLVRLVQSGQGYLEVGLSWYGAAGPLVDEWRDTLRRHVDEAIADASQGLLFDSLSRERQARIDTLLTKARITEHGRKAIEMILGQLGRQAQNPVVVPAEAFRVLLRLQEDNDWKSKVEGCLMGLQHLRSSLRSFDLERSLYGYGTFLASWTYVGRGPGGHGDGDYYLEISPQFVGCLRVFEQGHRKLRGRLTATTFNWSQDLEGLTRSELGWTQRSRDAGAVAERFHAFDSGRVFYNAAEGFTATQERLSAFLEEQLTLNRDAAAKDPATGRPWCKKLRGDSRLANEPRTYDANFCLLLPPNQSFHGALGHFTRAPENGRTLGGTPRRHNLTTTPRHSGLLLEMGYRMPPGATATRLYPLVAQALQDIQAVVVECYGGFAAVRGPDSNWMTAPKAQALPLDDLLYHCRWFLFLPDTWREDRRRRWETQTGYQATEDETQAQAIRDRRWAGDEESSGDDAGNALRLRLHAAMKERGLSQIKLARLFGVSQPAVSQWFRGTRPDPETGEVKGKPIPATLRPMIETWLTTGKAPTTEELANRQRRRTDRRGS